ncbi:fumarylacetoacetate hydrolase family protein [Alkaliflexus imshenetskii]|uniref:fumarylacetoacetate hydrolase family protein n=1 Tax=Alkaliflexus imshenetskii TaxID=286730 RepID=UPI00047C3273|nr:fumarylacetoacetate hydrolase family protein [Alkaliflexus imshenetskii]
MKILCIGRNYEEHAKELKNPLPPEPVVFSKPDSAILRNNSPFYLPDFAKDFHHEVELVIKISRLGKNIEAQYAHRYYDEIGLGIDFTARDLQDELRGKGLPWEKCKAFDGSAVISGFVAKEKYTDLNNINFSLLVNGQPRQMGNSRDMIFNVDQIISHVSRYFTLKIGDLIYTGTPAGVGPVAIGDRLQGYIEEELFFDFLVK